MTQAAIDLLKTQRNVAKTEAERLAKDLANTIRQGEAAQAQVNAKWAQYNELEEAIRTLEQSGREIPA